MRGFPLGGAEAKASTFEGLTAKYDRVISHFGHAASYFINRVTTVRLAEFSGPRNSEREVLPPSGLKVPDTLPSVGSIDVRYVVRDLQASLDLAVVDDQAAAISAARSAAGLGRPLAVDVVVTERLGLMDQRMPKTIWDSDLLAKSRASEVLASRAGIADSGLEL